MEPFFFLLLIIVILLIVSGAKKLENGLSARSGACKLHKWGLVVNGVLKDDKDIVDTDRGYLVCRTCNNRPNEQTGDRDV